jgi:hypothetical protein
MLHVMGKDGRRREAPPGVLELDGPDALDSLLPLADFVILTVPHTLATEGFMHRARFQRMKRTAFFINIGRGRTTRLDDLVEALRAGEIAGSTSSSRNRCRPTTRCGRCLASSSRHTPPVSDRTWTSGASRSCSTTAGASWPASRSATWWTRRPGSSRAHSRPLRLPDHVQHGGHTVAAI